MTSVVLDQEEFDQMVDGLIQAFDQNANDMLKIRENKILPLMKRGTKTQVFFDRYNVTTDYLSAIVRGQGKNIIQPYLERRRRDI